MKGHSPRMYGTLLSVSALSIGKYILQLANFIISVKSLRIALPMIVKNYGRIVTLCSFVVRYIFGPCFACFVSDLRIIRAWKLMAILNQLRKKKNFTYVTRDIRNCPCRRFFILAPGHGPSPLPCHLE